VRFIVYRKQLCRQKKYVFRWKKLFTKEGSQNSSILPKEDKIDARAKLAKTTGVFIDTYYK